MNNTPDGFSGRLRLYVTLVIQIVPLIVLSLSLTAANASRVGLLIAPLLLASVGPILELSGKRKGRTLTLTGLGVQVIAAIALAVAILTSGSGLPKLSAGDLGGVAFLASLIIIPGSLLVWNFQGGRTVKPDVPGAA